MSTATDAGFRSKMCNKEKIGAQPALAPESCQEPCTSGLYALPSDSHLMIDWLYEEDGHTMVPSLSRLTPPFAS